MDAVANPYAPGAGQRPPELAGRESEQLQFSLLLDRLQANRAERGIVLTGLRGVGKTVLLEELRARAEERRWVSAFVEADTDRPFRSLAARALTASLRAASLRHRSSARLRRALSVFKSFSLQGAPDGSLSIGLEVEPAPGRGDSGDLELDLSELLTDLGEAAADLDSGVLLVVDEMQSLRRTDAAAILGAAHQTNRLGLPVAVAGAGLPNLPAFLTGVKTYAERLFGYRRIGALGMTAAAEALERPADALRVAWAGDAVEHAVQSSGGYPYFLQAFGKRIWEFAPGPDTIDLKDALVGVEAARRDLDDSFFGTRWERATTAQRAYMSAMAAESGGTDTSVSSGATARRLNKSHSAISPHREKLIEKGLIYPPERGRLAFPVPGFSAYVLERRGR